MDDLASCSTERCSLDHTQSDNPINSLPARHSCLHPAEQTYCLPSLQTSPSETPLHQHPPHPPCLNHHPVRWVIWPPPMGAWAFAFMPIACRLNAVKWFYDSLAGFSCPSAYVMSKAQVDTRHMHKQRFPVDRRAAFIPCLLPLARCFHQPCLLLSSLARSL